MDGIYLSVGTLGLWLGFRGTAGYIELGTEYPANKS
jgi:hypothetical protein